MAVEVKGIKELNEKLRKLGKIDSKPALLKGAYKLQGYAQKNSPVDTGFLRASHNSQITEEGAEMIVNAEYGVYLELGTKYIKARGWIAKAIDEHAKDIVKTVKDHIENEIKGVV